MASHLTDDQLINILYEIDERTPHLDKCDGCRTRWEQMLERRHILPNQPAIPEDVLAQQRRRILQRIDDAAGWEWIFRPSAAIVSVCVMVLAVLLSRPQPIPEPKTIATNDSQLFGEIYSMVESSEPSAANPIYGLFEERQ